MLISEQDDVQTFPPLFIAKTRTIEFITQEGVPVSLQVLSVDTVGGAFPARNGQHCIAYNTLTTITEGYSRGGGGIDHASSRGQKLFLPERPPVANCLFLRCQMRTKKCFTHFYLPRRLQFQAKIYLLQFEGGEESAHLVKRISE